MIAQVRRKLARILVAAARLVDVPAPPVTPDESAILRAVAGHGETGLDANAFLRSLYSCAARGLIRRSGPGRFDLTEAGRAALEAT